MVNSDYLKNLNEAQKEAVTHLEGPLLIVAGAGSGKTKVLTSKNCTYYCKEKKAFPNQILSVTFTNKAAKEMQNRVIKILGCWCNWFILVRHISFYMCKTIKKTCISCKLEFKLYNYRYR